MDALYATPLFDLFRRGEVAPDIRLLAAQGVLAPRAVEQLALLVHLTADADPHICATAEATIRRIPVELLAAFVGRPDVPEDVRAFFVARGIEPAVPTPGDEGAPLVSTGDGVDGDPPGSGGHDEAASGGASEPAAEARRMATVQRLAALNVTGRMKAAMRGTREERAILIRDPNKLVSVAVLSSPKLTEQEVEGFARLGSVSEDVLRVIGTSRAWVKNYGVVKGLCLNPKTPIALSLGFVKRLVERDIKQVATDRNIPDPVKIAARKILQAGQTRRA